MLLQVDQIVEFEESQIQLDIPFPSTEGLKATFNDDWRILSLSPPLVIDYNYYHIFVMV